MVSLLPAIDLVDASSAIEAVLKSASEDTAGLTAEKLIAATTAAVASLTSQVIFPLGAFNKYRFNKQWKYACLSTSADC